VAFGAIGGSHIGEQRREGKCSNAGGRFHVILSCPETLKSDADCACAGAFQYAVFFDEFVWQQACQDLQVVGTCLAPATPRRRAGKIPDKTKVQGNANVDRRMRNNPMVAYPGFADLPIL
jgi:hypothetical protein